MTPGFYYFFEVDIGRKVVTFGGWGNKSILFGTVSSFRAESGNGLRWGVEYGCGDRDDLDASQLYEKLRLAVVIDSLVADGRAFICSDCCTCFQTAQGLRYLQIRMMPYSLFMFYF